MDTPSSLLINGPAGSLELAISSSTTDSTAWGIICHAHPLLGGTMSHKVITTIAKVFSTFGIGIVRFHFRGVGKSEGSFDNGQGELADLFAIIDWLVTEKGATSLWLAGFSFGAYIAAQAASQLCTPSIPKGFQAVMRRRRRQVAECTNKYMSNELSRQQSRSLKSEGDIPLPPLQQVILVAPPVTRFPLHPLPPITCPWIVVQGEEDEVVPLQAVLDWIQDQPNPPTLLRFKETGHFFHGQLLALQAQLKSVLSRTMLSS